MNSFAMLATAMLLLLNESAPAQIAKKTAPASIIKTPPALISEVDGRTFEEWKTDLKHPDPSVRTRAILAVAQFGPRTVDAVRLLLDRCRDNDASPRVKAIMAFGVIEIAENDEPAVIDALAYHVGQDTQAIIRYHAAVVLEKRFADHPHARSAVGGLLKGAADPTWEIRRVCLTALRHCGRDDKTGPEPRVTVAMMRALQDFAADVRLEAAVGLGAMGRPGDPVLLGQIERALLGVVRDRDRSVAIWSQVSIMALADKVKDSQLEVLAKGLSSPDVRIRAQTTRAIGALGDRARPCLAALVTALRDKERMVVIEACGALVNVGANIPKVTDALTELSKSKESDEELRESAKAALELINHPKQK